MRLRRALADPWGLGVAVLATIAIATLGWGPLLAIAVGVATSLALAGAVLLLASEAQAQHDEPSAITRPAVSPAATDRIDAINRNRDLP